MKSEILQVARYLRTLLGGVVVAQLCLVLPACRQGESLPHNDTMPDHQLTGFNGNFQAQANSLQPPSSDDPHIFSDDSLWIKAGDPIPQAAWNNYEVGLSCKKNGLTAFSHPDFTFNLCDQGCLSSLADNMAREASNSSPPWGAFCQVPDDKIPSSCTDRHPIYLVNTDQISAIPAGTHDAYYVNNDKVWLLQYECPGGNCFSGNAVTSTSFSWNQGCSAAQNFALSGADPVAGNDFILKLWASHRPDFTAENTPQSDDRGPVTLFLHVVGTMNKIDRRRVDFKEQCGPPPLDFCNSGSSESQWVAKDPATESFSQNVKVAAIKVFADAVGDNPVVFCSAFLGTGDERADEAFTLCDAQHASDCIATPMTPYTPADPRGIRITFQNKMQSGSATRCPNLDSSITNIWVEFALVQK